MWIFKRYTMDFILSWSWWLFFHFVSTVKYTKISFGNLHLSTECSIWKKSERNGCSNETVWFHVCKARIDLRNCTFFVIFTFYSCLFKNFWNILQSTLAVLNTLAMPTNIYAPFHFSATGICFWLFSNLKTL